MFKLRYFRNPLDRAWPRDSGRGYHLLNTGLHRLKKKVAKPHSRINSTKNAKQAIHGLAYLYGFRYQSCLKDNLIQKRKYYYFNDTKCTLIEWIKIISHLNQELVSIAHYANLSTLLRSRYAKYIQIANINKYYHPRKRHYAENARTELAQLGSNRRYQFTGTFQRFGSKTNGQLTILLTDIRYQNKLVTHHLWFNATKQFRQLGHLDTGEHLTFRARVKTYRKGYLPNDFIKHYDYELTYPSQIKRC